MAAVRSHSRSSVPRIGIDLMGSDSPPEVLFQAVLQLSEENIPAELVVFATKEVLNELSWIESAVEVKEFISMEDDPIFVVRRKKESSMAVGMRILNEKGIDAFVSAGNTGALLLTAKWALPTLPGIDRPALLTLLPTKGKDIAVLDVGANLTLKSTHILQFAAMGIAYQKSRGIPNPTVGLLNVGTEAKKGTPQLREAYEKLETLNRDTLTFVGNVEGKDAFQGDIDVLVTDGFSGNVFLKTAEGIASFILEELEKSQMDLKGILSKLRRRLHYAEYPGAILCGVDGIVVKCHGDSTPEALMNGVKGAIRLVQHAFLDKIKRQMNKG
jgi:glycerol-3-phosphate acyltransferase PlsX